MARTVKDSQLDSRTARARLKPRKRLYWRALDSGVHLGYRRLAHGGTWNVRLYLGDGKYQVALLGTADDYGDADGATVLNFTQAQAAARARHAQATRAANGLPEPSAGPYTVKDALGDYVAWLESEGRSEQSIKDTKWRIKSHIIPRLDAVRLDRLTRKQIEDWHRSLAKIPPRVRVKTGTKQRHRDVDMKDPEVKRARQATANRTLTILKSALNAAWRAGKVTDDKPWRSVKPFKGVTASRARYLQLDDCRRLINAANDGDDFHDIAEGGLHTGARWGELCRFKPQDFNRDAGTIAVHLSKSRKARHIVLNDDGIRFFAKAVARAHNREHLFVRSDGEPWGRGWQIRLMKAACERAHIKPAAGFHILRHTWASHAVMAGMPLLLVARNLGHRDTRMVELHYGHLAPDYAANEIRRGAPRFGLDTGTVTPLRTARHS